MSDIKKVIKGRVESLYTDAKALAEEIQSKSEKFQEDSIKIRENKKKMEDLKLKEEDFYDDIASTAKMNHTLFFMGENYKHVVSCLYELDILMGLLGISYEDIDIEEGTEIKNMAKSASPLYTTKSGKVVVADEELHNMVTASMDQRLSDKKVLSQSFKMIN